MNDRTGTESRLLVESKKMKKPKNEKTSPKRGF